MQKRLLILFILLGLATAYSLISLFTQDSPYINDDTQAAVSYTKHNAQPSNSLGSQRIVTAKQPVSPTFFDGNDSLEQNVDAPTNLPFNIKLVGISTAASEKIHSNDDEDIAVLVQFENDLHKHTLHDYVSNSEIQIVAIDKTSINVEFETIIYNISLTPPNLLANDFKDEEQSYEELANMTASDISTRPRIIEHLFTLTPTPYIADGKIVTPGLNPELFEQAGFKVDDVLKTINGKRVTVDSELEEIKEELRSAQTLEFLVMRRGRMVTLYLDIPSETLELVAD
jgi:hypothetical protein